MSADNMFDGESIWDYQKRRKEFEKEIKDYIAL